MVLKSVWKRPKLQAQTSQFEMTVQADVAVLDDMFLLWICSQIYPILQKPKYNPKSFFKKLELKALRLTYEQQLPECISLPQRDKSATDKALQRNGRQNHYPKEFSTPG